MNKTGIIYMATNKVNGKAYIGQTSKPLKVRMKSHEKDAFRLNKYGSYKYSL